MWVLDGVENKDLTLIDHALVIMEDCSSLFATDTLNGEQTQSVGGDPQNTSKSNDLTLITLDPHCANSRSSG